MDPLVMSSGEGYRAESDADSDLEELKQDMAKHEESVRQFIAAQQGDIQPSREHRGPRGRGTRGPRKAAKPRGDITARLSKVNQEFLAGNYEVALQLAFEVIRINAETHQAWTAVTSILQEQGHPKEALLAMYLAAHLRPKDISGWLHCASYALEIAEDFDSENVRAARLCYSAAIKADPQNIEARLGKAALCHKQGHLASAISEYTIVLRYRPYELDIVRKLAEASIDSKHAAKARNSAIHAYKSYFTIALEKESVEVLKSLWHDVDVYVELLASVGRYEDSIFEIKRLSRWLDHRGTETFWNDWTGDDREWDANDDRRALVPEFELTTSSSKYGSALPGDLRTRLAIYRSKLGQERESQNHLTWLQPCHDTTFHLAADYPFLIIELADELSRTSQDALAIQYLGLLTTSLDMDPIKFLLLGRCHLKLGNLSVAEEHLLTAIEIDEDNIEARFELAHLYEKAKEDEEALILAAEALALQNARRDNPITEQDPPNAVSSGTPKSLSTSSVVFSEQRFRLNRLRRPLVPRRYRPKRLASPAKRLEEEQAHALKLSQLYQVVNDLKDQIRCGRQDLVASWMASSKELTDDFRSLRKFYTWKDYYISRSATHASESTKLQPNTELTKMYERLKQSVGLPSDTSEQPRDYAAVESHIGISFDKWLDLFLDYAVGLALAQRNDEAYQVCEDARASTVFQNPKSSFAIKIASSVCAILANDEERCVDLARQLIREGAVSDSYRLFGLLCFLCQCPTSWYTSGPAQKFVLRQIKAMDVAFQRNLATSSPASSSLNVCLLMLYGHILFTSTSYTYALGYFARARSLDPHNPMVNLSLGLGYVHYALKRQASNRQFLLLQGQYFISKYYSDTMDEADNSMNTATAYFNVGRLYHLLGISYLAGQNYTWAVKEASQSQIQGVQALAIFNQLVLNLNTGNLAKVYWCVSQNII